jgi:flagellar biogenesis protein FliO
MSNEVSKSNNTVKMVLIAISVLAFVALVIYVLNNMGDVEIAGDH